MNAVEVGVALTPKQFRSIEARDHQKEEERAALDGLHHEVGDGPDIPLGNATGEVAVIDGEGEKNCDDSPERYVTENVAQPQPRQREVLGEGRGWSEGLMHGWQAPSDKRVDGQGFREIMLFRFGSATALGTCRQGFDR